ncbi:hypothetical protein FDP41_009099 [Naegleria fowleri]|nr:uncharacterized protein FDP41_009099 [Naegleria fowleri]KAF0972850.1 hypothetical protein FDP41_009099 [Naegleria fowleri]
MQNLLQEISNEFEKDICIAMLYNVADSKMGTYIHELAVLVKQLEYFLIEKDVSTTVLRPNEWYSEDIVEVYDIKDEDFIEIDVGDDDKLSNELDEEMLDNEELED